MRKEELGHTIGLYREAIRRAGQNGLPMRIRLLCFLLLFLNAIMLGIFLILSAAGVFQGGLSEHKAVLEKELTYISQNIYRELGSISVQATALSERLSANIQQTLQEQGSSIHQLQASPHLLEPILEEALTRLIGALEKSGGSGVFLLLDATINPSLPNAENSKACIYLKNMEPNIVNRTAANLRYCIGPISIARKNDIHILPQWQLEADIGAMPWLTQVMDTAQNSALSVSRLYRWSKSTILPNNTERIMLCAVPLIAEDGTVFGLCGFEVSEMLFELSHTPQGEDYDHLLCIFSPFEEKELYLEGALFAGDFAASPEAPAHTQMMIFPDERSFFSYQQEQREHYAGLQQEISLYPSDSAHREERWAVVLMMPEDELHSLISIQNWNLALGLSALILVSIGAAIYISYRYIRPVAIALEQIKNPGLSPKTRIPEIDDLIEFLATQDDTSAKINLDQEQSTLFKTFVQNISTLSQQKKRYSISI